MSSVATVEDIAALESGLTEGNVTARPGRSVGLWIGVAILALTIVSALVVKLAHIGHPDTINLTNTLAAPSFSAPFGTDALGRNVFLRTVYAGALDIQVGVVTTVVPLCIGMFLGVVSGFFGGWVDSVLMRIMDAFLAFPFIVLIIAFVTIFGVGLTGVYIGLIVASVPFFARITRGEMLVLREQQFILAARTLGYSTPRIVFKHALPHLVRPNVVFAPSCIVGNILTLAALSYLGLGVQPPEPEWGAIIASGQPYLFTQWWLSTLPGVFVVIVGIGFSLAGEGLVDRFRVQSA